MQDIIKKYSFFWSLYISAQLCLVSYIHYTLYMDKYNCGLYVDVFCSVDTVYCSVVQKEK